VEVDPLAGIDWLVENQNDVCGGTDDRRQVD
jgi:hypothetical protein